MLLKKYLDYRMRLGLGQLFGILGMIGLIASGALGNPSLLSYLMKETSAYDFLRGFLAGLGGGLLGLSLVFNVAALISIRNDGSTRNRM